MRLFTSLVTAGLAMFFGQPTYAAPDENKIIALQQSQIAALTAQVNKLSQNFEETQLTMRRMLVQSICVSKNASSSFAAPFRYKDDLNKNCKEVRPDASAAGMVRTGKTNLQGSRYYEGCGKVLFTASSEPTVYLTLDWIKEALAANALDLCLNDNAYVCCST